MPGETILVVEDTEVNLKLTTMVLRNEGFEVHTAVDAESALETLRTLHPDIILVDIQLPGMDGLELTRLVKQDPRTRDVIMVAVTASAMKGDEQKVREAGCDGYITKPIDTRELGKRVRQYLNGRADAQPAAPKVPSFFGGLSISRDEMEGLKRRFLSEGSGHSHRILDTFDSRFDAVEASRLAHQWIGAAGVLGYMKIADLSAEVEALLEAPRWDRTKLRESLSALAMAFAEPPEAAETPLPEPIVKELEGKRVAIVGFSDEEADLACAAMERVGARPRLFNAEDSPDSDTVRICDAVMVHARPETMSSDWLTRDAYAPNQALVLVGRREHALALDPAVQARAQEFLIDGWQPEEALLRLRLALSRLSPAAQATPPSVAPRAVTDRAEIVVADDDMMVLTVVRTMLESSGLICHTAMSGPDALQKIRDHRPHAAVLDVNMPGLSGFEVVSAIREEGLPVRVLLLTARRQENDVVRGFSIGADDYVVKPFNSMELVARLKRLLSR